MCCFHRMDLQNVKILNKVIVVIDFYLNSRCFTAFFFLFPFVLLLLYLSIFFFIIFDPLKLQTFFFENEMCVGAPMCVRPCACSFQFGWYSFDIYIYNTALCCCLLDVIFFLLASSFYDKISYLHPTFVRFNVSYFIQKYYIKYEEKSREEAFIEKWHKIENCGKCLFRIDVIVIAVAVVVVIVIAITIAMSVCMRTHCRNLFTEPVINALPEESNANT